MANAQQGLKGDYYTGRNFNRKFTTRVDPQINFNWNKHGPIPGMPESEYSIRWTGRIQAPETGEYEFSAIVDDGIRLWVGGIKVIEEWGPHNHEFVGGKVGMKAGQFYDIRIEYYNGLLEGQIQLKWELPQNNRNLFEKISGSASTIERKHFYPPPVPTAQPSKVEIYAKPVEPEIPKAEVVKELANVSVPTPPSPPKPPVENIIPEKKVEIQAPTGISKMGSKMADTIAKYTPKNILFEPGEPFIMPESYPELNQLVKLLKRFARLKIQIDGHTDITGDPKLNMQLSKDRASEVAYYLEEQGISADRIFTKGYGSTKPVEGKDNQKMYPQNRRVEFRIY
jgi:outer membrane protein OmpA-like peptidoglycan-associated protein